MTLLFSAVLLTAVYAVSRRRLEIIIARSWATLVIAVEILHLILQSDSILMVQNSLAAGFLVYTLFLLLRLLFSEQQVTFEAISASLCGYLLLGLLWANMYSLLYLAQPDSFSSVIVATLSNDSTNLQFGTEASATALYFSYVTLTTLGYGDIVPATTTARMLCTVEAIVGQMYLVARLVGLHIAFEQRGRSS